MCKCIEATEPTECGSADPQVALLLLCQCGGFCKWVHLSRSTPSSLVVEALRLYDDNVRQCFTECTSVDTPDNAWEQSLGRGGFGLRCLSHHSSAVYIASLTASDSDSNTNHHMLQFYNTTIPLFHLLKLFRWKQFWSYQATKNICLADLKTISSGCPSIFISA